MAADLNLDGHTDPATLHEAFAGVYTQWPDGTFGDEELNHVLSAATIPPKALAVGDVSGDKFPGIVLANGSGLGVMRSTGQVRSWGPCPPAVTTPDRVLAVVAGWYHTVAVAITGTTPAWGWNHFGQLGNGTTANAPRAVRVPGIDPTGIAAGAGHALAITARGR